MKIEYSLNPNCSEAVMRIRTDRLTKEEKQMLYNTLEGAVENYEGDSTYVNEDTLFGIEMIIVDGDMPYNRSEDLEDITKKYDVDVEFSE